ENLKDSVVVQPFAARESTQAATGNSVQSAVVGANPDCAVRVLVDGTNPAADEALALVVLNEVAVRQAGHAAETADPQRTRAVLVQRGDPIVRQAIVDGVAGGSAIRRDYQAIVRGKPHSSAAILVNRP